MDTPTPIVQIYSTADDHTQWFVANLLRQHDLIASTVQTDTDCYVIVDCEDDDKAWWVYEFVMSIGVDASLLHASGGSTAVNETHGPHEFA